MKPITTLFLDIGGVLLTNGWDHNQRESAVRHFGLEIEEFDVRHRQTYNLHETGKISLDHYLNSVVFWKERNFSLDEFKRFMLAQSQPHPEMLLFISKLKKKHSLKVVIISNEGREVVEYRIQKYDLKAVADCFIVSCFVGAQKPAIAIYRLALDLAQVLPEEVLYIDDRKEMIAAAEAMGICSVQHVSLESTRAQLADFSLS